MSKAERTKAFIIEKAAPIVNRKGIAGTSITDIMEATQLAKGGIYGNFSSKEEICAEALSYLLNGIGAAIDARVAESGSAFEKFCALLGYYADTLERKDNYGCPMLNFGAEADDTDQQIRLRVSKAISVAENKIRQIVQMGIDRGELDERLDAAQFALKAFTMIEGGMWMSRVQGNPEKMQQIVEMLKGELEGYRR